MTDTTLRDTLRLAEDDIGAGRPEEALTRCHHILAHYPEMLEARRVIGEAYLALLQTKEAYQAFDRVLVSDPENTLAYCGRALINQQVGDLDSALDCYYQACELSLGNRQLRLEFRRLASQANQPDFVLSRVGLARLYMRGDLLAHATREWEQVLQSDPERVDARLGLAEALWRDGQSARAASQCRLILQAIPSCLKALLLLGEIAYRTGHRNEASEYLEQARRQDPDGRMARELFADALIYDEAFAAFILAEPARIPLMADSADETAKLPAFLSPARWGETPHSDTGTLIGAAEERDGFLTNDPFSFSFLGIEATSGGPPLREGESLEELLAALIERPILPEVSLTPRLADIQAPAPPADRLESLLMSFSHPPEPDAPAGVTPPTREPAGLALLRPRREEEWVEEDTEAGWLRWLQAQGAQSLEASQGLHTETGPLAAFLHSTNQAETPRATLWEAPDPEFARTFWPHDTVPQPAVRLAPGSATRPIGAAQSQAHGNAQQSGAQGDDPATPAGISSVSLRPLTLEELERSFSASGLTRWEGTLAALAGNTNSDLQGPGAVTILTIAEDDYPARLELAEHQRKMGRIDEALGHYRAVLRGAPELIDQVISELLAAAGERPDQAAVFRLLGDAYTRRGDYMEALEAYNRGLAASRGL